MKFITFITELENIDSRYKHAIITGMRWGMWIGGIIALAIVAVTDACFGEDEPKTEINVPDFIKDWNKQRFP